MLCRHGAVSQRFSQYIEHIHQPATVRSVPSQLERSLRGSGIRAGSERGSERDPSGIRAGSERDPSGIRAGHGLSDSVSEW